MNKLIEYLLCEDSGHTQWTNDISGARACQFTLSELPNNKIVMHPKREFYSELAILFFMSGQIVVQRTDAKLEKIEKDHVVVLKDASSLHVVEINERLQGILVLIDSRSVKEREISAYTLLGLHMDLDLLKSSMELWNGCASFCNSYWTEAVFDLLPYLPEKAWGRYCILKALELLYILGAKHYGVKHLAGERGNSQAMQSVLAAQAYMQTHITQKITISDLSRVLSVSPTYLKTEFRRVSGMSIHRWQMDLRMRRAGELIRCTDKQICKIAQEVGYEGMSQFCTVFKRYYGITPGQFKKCPIQEFEVCFDSDN